MCLDHYRNSIAQSRVSGRGARRASARCGGVPAAVSRSTRRRWGALPRASDVTVLDTAPVRSKRAPRPDTSTTFPFYQFTKTVSGRVLLLLAIQAT